MTDVSLLVGPRMLSFAQPSDSCDMSNQAAPDSSDNLADLIRSGEWIDVGAHFGGRFLAHGRVKFRYEAALVFCEAVGPFNAEFFQGLARWAAKLRERGLGGPRAGFVVNYLNSILFTADSLADYRTFLNGPRNAAFVAYVIPMDVEGRNLMIPVLTRLWEEAGREYRLFENLAEATAWAQARVESLGPARSE